MLTPAFEVTATAAQPPTSAPVPTPTVQPPTAAPSLTPVPTSSPTPQGPTAYDLLIVKRKDEGLFLANQTAAVFPLASLHLGDDEGAVDSIDWGLAGLENGACVNVWKDKGEPKLPEELTCRQVGQNLTRGKKDVFWNEAFNVYYSEQRVAICGKEPSVCSIRILTQAGYTLLIAKRDNESLFVVNQAMETFPLAMLRLENDKGGVNGDDWGVAQLESGACVAAWGKKGDPKPPEGVPCDSPVGARLTDENKEPFWRETINVYYGEELVATCDKKQKECLVNIPAE